MPESFQSRPMISDISLGMVPSSMVSERCSSLRASSYKGGGFSGAWGLEGTPAQQGMLLTWRAVSPYWMLRVVMARTMASMDWSVLL